MKLDLWSPFFDFEEDFRPSVLRRFFRDIPAFGFRPSIDLVRKDGELVMTAELPGIDLEDIDVSIDDGMLTVKGEKAEEKETSEDNRYVHERSYGKFVRRVPLPEGVSADKVTADYDKGVLTIKVTLPEEITPEPRRIPVEVKTAS